MRLFSWTVALALVVALLAGEKGSAQLFQRKKAHIIQAMEDGRVIQPLWLRGRLFRDVRTNTRFDPKFDKPIANKRVKIGRMVGGSFVGLGSAKTGADGVFDIRFNAGAGGTFIILDAKTQLRLSKFKWPENKRFHGLLIPQSPPKTSTRTRTTTTTTTSKTKTKTSTTTVPCGPFYDGTTLPFRAWKGPDPSHYRATFLDIDVNPTDGSIYACGYTETEFYFESFNVSANWAKRGFVMKMDRMGVIKWVQALNQETGQQSEIGSCKLSTDQTSLWISAISSENPIKFGTFIFPLTGNRDGLIATLATSTGSITYATSFGTLSKYLFNSGRVSPSGSNVYLSHNAKLGGLSLPNGKSVACTYGDCCFLAKYSGSTLLWATTFVDVSILAFLMYCYPSAVTSADGSKVFVAGKDTIAIFDSGTGAIIASKQVVNTSEIMDIAILGTDLFIVGTSIEPSIMVDSVKVSKPSPGVQRWGYIIRFATTATGFAASAATYIGTDEFQAHIWSLRPAYSVAGYPKALVMTIELRGSRLKTGTGYVSPTYYGEPCTINFQYSLGVVFLIDGATLNGISSTLFSGKAAVPQIVPSNEIGWFEFLYTATSNPMDGSIYAAGISTRRVNTTVSQCGYWNYTVEGWGYGGGLGTPIVVKLDSELELPTARG